MARNLQLALSLFARDGASKVLKQALQDIIKQTKATQKAGDEQAKAQQQNTTTAIRASRSLQDEYRRASSARSSLGIRSERDIQREIQLTMAAYNRLTRTGLMSSREQSRAFRSMSERVRELRTELGGVSNTMTRLQNMKPMASKVAAVAGGVAAAAMVIKDPVQRQMAFERKNAEMANTAYNNLSPEERKNKIPVMNAAIQKAVREGGGTPEAAQSTLGSLFAAGQVDNETAMKILPDIMKYSSASGANPEDLAKIASAGIANFGIKAKDLPTFFDKSIRSGENGSFELADMAAKLSTQMAAASKLGMGGLKDYDKLLAMNQANALTSGSPESAATNVEGYLNKITSSDTQNAMKNYRFRGRDGKSVGYLDYLAQQRKSGVNTSDAFMNAVEGIVSSNKDVQKLRSESKQYQGTDKGKNIDAALQVLISSITSKIIADREAGAALATNIMQKNFIKEQISGTRNATGAGAASFDVISSTNDFKSQQFESEKMFAEQNSMKPVADLYGDLTSKLTDYAKEYPELTTALSGATTAVKAMSAAAVAFAGINLLTGGGIKLPGGGAGATGTGGVLGRTWQAIKGGGSRVGGRLLGKLLAPLALYQAAEDAPLVPVERGDAEARARLQQNKYSNSSARTLDAMKARPGLLDVVDEVKSWWSSPATIGQAGPGSSGVPSYLLPSQQKQQPVQITTKLEVDGREMASVVNEYNGEQSNRGSTGGTNP